MRPIASLALLLLPVDARPLGAAALNLAESCVVGWRQTRSDSFRPPLWRVGLVGSVLFVLAILPGLASASPPDPSWIPGLYDDADYDDVVLLVTSETARVDPGLLPDLRPILTVVRHAPACPGVAGHSRPASVIRLRAPPAS